MSKKKSESFKPINYGFLDKVRNYNFLSGLYKLPGGKFVKDSIAKAGLISLLGTGAVGCGDLDNALDNNNGNYETREQKLQASSSEVIINGETFKAGELLDVPGTTSSYDSHSNLNIGDNIYLVHAVQQGTAGIQYKTRKCAVNDFDACLSNTSTEKDIPGGLGFTTANEATTITYDPAIDKGYILGEDIKEHGIGITENTDDSLILIDEGAICFPQAVKYFASDPSMMTPDGKIRHASSGLVEFDPINCTGTKDIDHPVAHGNIAEMPGMPGIFIGAIKNTNATNKDLRVVIGPKEVFNLKLDFSNSADLTILENAGGNFVLENDSVNGELYILNCINPTVISKNDVNNQLIGFHVQMDLVDINGNSIGQKYIYFDRQVIVQSEPDPELGDADVSDSYTEVSDATTNEVDGTNPDDTNQFDGTDAQIDAEVDTAIKEICTGDGDGICEDREY